MRSLVALAAAAALGGCHSADPDAANSGDQPSEAQVIATQLNEQDALDNAINSDAPQSAGTHDPNDDGNSDDGNTADSAGNTATATGVAGGSQYSCSDGTTIHATYTAKTSATVTINGKPLTLTSVAAASGSKYHLDQGLAPGRSLTWWNQGDTALLIQTPSGATEGAPKELRTTCLRTNAAAG